ncbi:MAG: SCO family protein, partial [Proteobacteria bacterium]|nr:SCO family protein [Pseudomonadota bacterium]
HLMFFGFSECKTECPVAMQQITRAYNQLIPEEQKQLQVVFISVDPKNDTLPVLKKFITAFNPAFTAWRGEKPEVDAITRNYLAYYAIKTDGKQQYQVNHSSYIYLMGPQGTYLTHFRGSDADATLLETLKSILKNTTK